MTSKWIKVMQEREQSSRLLSWPLGKQTADPADANLTPTTVARRSVICQKGVC